jgi:hypothetical protein
LWNKSKFFFFVVDDVRNSLLALEKQTIDYYVNNLLSRLHHLNLNKFNNQIEAKKVEKSTKLRFGRKILGKRKRTSLIKKNNFIRFNDCREFQNFKNNFFLNFGLVLPERLIEKKFFNKINLSSCYLLVEKDANPFIECRWDNKSRLSVELLLKKQMDIEKSVFFHKQIITNLREEMAQQKNFAGAVLENWKKKVSFLQMKINSFADLKKKFNYLNFVEKDYREKLQLIKHHEKQSTYYQQLNLSYLVMRDRLVDCEQVLDVKKSLLKKKENKISQLEKSYFESQNKCFFLVRENEQYCFNLKVLIFLNIFTLVFLFWTLFPSFISFFKKRPKE